jgi:Na+-transporting methylmalonyl-CoA/oxaloacetate decarboxylase gamma subunit
MNTEALSLSLWITLIGMAIVFSAIIVLWIGMAVLVYAFRDRLSNALEESAPAEVEGSAIDRKRQAAAAAVAIALASVNRKRTVQQQFPLPPTALVSAWQAVMRANNFSKRGRVK